MPSRNASPPGTEARLPALAAALVLLCACQPQERPFSEKLHVFGTLVTLSFYDTDAATAARAAADLERRYRQLGRDWYPWHPSGTGELQRINAAIAAGETIEVSAPLAELLKRAAEIERRSGGLFNPALGALTALWRFHEPFAGDWRPPAPEAIAALIATRPSGTQLSWDGNTLKSESTAPVLDLGGIAKGAILALSSARLQRLGIDDAIIDLGGDLIVLGDVGGRAARIGIRDPGGEALLGWLQAQDGEAVVTSGNYERYFEHDGERYAHVLDPANGWPARDTAAVTVVHRDPVLADAAATALLVAGERGFTETCDALGIDTALLVGASGDVRLTPAMENRVHWLLP